jgi:ribA/ribD-fused uncharacterized protein
MRADLLYPPDAVTSFTGHHAFLSNFHHSPISMSLGLAGLVFPTAEHAFQAAKAVRPGQFGQPDLIAIRDAATPREAKRLGRRVELRPGWDQMKKRVMLVVVLAKFEQHHDLAEALAGTGSLPLIEGNTWHDDYWGNCHCGRAECAQMGGNWLGQILEMARALLQPDGQHRLDAVLRQPAGETR